MPQKTLLSPHFSLEELIKTSRAEFVAANVAHATAHMDALKMLASYILEPARAILNVPLIVTSALRCAGLNAVFGGVANSQHVTGEAADFVPLGLSVEAAYDILRAAPISYGQLILEPGWLHISLGAPRRALAKCRQAFKR